MQDINSSQTMKLRQSGKLWKRKQEYFTVVTPAVKIYNNVKNKNKFIADSFNTYFWTIVERMNTETAILITVCVTKYLTEAIP
jgi:hypothetical protein